MKEGSQRNVKKVTMITAIIILITGSGWLMFAISAGMFIPHDERFAVEPGKFSPDIMAAKKG